MGSRGEDDCGGGSEVSEETKRAIEMLKVAAAYIRKYCPDKSIYYDEAMCDGYCVADDCDIAVVLLEATQ